jgi:putative lipase involved disintegration of autophagic bodies
MLFSLLPTTLNLLLGYFFPYQPTDNGLIFHLRHEHAVHVNSSRLILNDFIPTSSLSDAFLDTSTISNYDGIQTRHVQTKYRSYLPSNSLRAARAYDDPWLGREVPGPDVNKRATLLQLAKMTSNAYTNPDAKDWYTLGDDFPDNSTLPFGWEPDADGFRGHIFVSADNSTVVVSVKGTSAGWLAGGGGPTVKKDQLNDNLLFSCCCARVGPTWSTVCGCYNGKSRCDIECLEESLVEESLFYSVGTNLYNNVTYMYPDANIWFIGHSLGGALASLIGTTFGLPVVAFEAPGEKMAAARLHLPVYPNMDHITHVRNNGDSIAMGTCNGVTSVCALGGYAMESKCHLGKSIIYDTVGQLNWSVGTSNHGIKVVIDNVLSDSWWKGEGDEEGREVPLPREEEDCVDCYNWEFGHFKDASFIPQLIKP